MKQILSKEFVIKYKRIRPNYKLESENSNNKVMMQCFEKNKRLMLINKNKLLNFFN